MNKRIDGLWQNVEDAKKEISNLRERIKTGEETLGSKFDDFVFYAVGATPKFWEPFYELRDKIKSSVGQELLIVSCEKTPSEPMISYLENSHGIMAPPVFYDTKYNFDYGLLTQENLDFDISQEQIIFPTGRKHFHLSGESFCGIDLNLAAMDPVRGRLRKKAVDLPHLARSINFGMLSFYSGEHISEVLTGPEVGAYFGKIVNGEPVYSELKKRL